MKYPKDKLMQQNLALPVIAGLEQQMEKLKIEKRIVKIEPLVKKQILIVFTGCSSNVLSKEGNKIIFEQYSWDTQYKSTSVLPKYF